jgi:phage host-nuclease inhibitor protein Gam
MKTLSILTCGIMIFFLGLTPAFSQDRAVMTKSDKGACKADIEKFCKDIKPGEGRLQACIKSNEDRLTQQCKDHMVREQEKTKEFIRACKDESKKFCKEIKPGQGRIVSCLKSHEAELSDTCKASLRK